GSRGRRATPAAWHRARIGRGNHGHLVLRAHDGPRVLRASRLPRGGGGVCIAQFGAALPVRTSRRLTVAWVWSAIPRSRAATGGWRLRGWRSLSEESMKLYAHPFSSYSQKVLIALYENGTPFEYRNLEDAAATAELASCGHSSASRCSWIGNARSSRPAASS